MTTPTVRVRIANIEHSMVSQPCPILDRTTLPRTPVIRIYGTSTEGYKACVHIHEVFPYFYVEYKGSMDPSIGDAAFLLSPFSVLTRVHSCSDAIHFEIDPFVKPRACNISPKRTLPPQISLCPVNLAHERSTFLWIQYILLSVPQSSPM
jgi:hypothetical protein